MPLPPPLVRIIVSEVVCLQMMVICQKQPPQNGSPLTVPPIGAEQFAFGVPLVDVSPIDIKAAPFHFPGYKGFFSGDLLVLVAIKPVLVVSKNKVECYLYTF